jgi:hypothetical protein
MTLLSTHGEKVLGYIGDELLLNRDLAILMVKNYGVKLYRLCENFRDDELIVRLATYENPLALEYASMRWRKDKELVLSLIEKNEKVFSFADSSLTENRSFCLAAVQRNDYCIQMMNSFHGDPELHLIGRIQIRHMHSSDYKAA